METPKQFETIKKVHQVDQLLGRVVDAVDDAQLKARILELKEQWQPLAYDVSAYLCGMEPAAGRPRKKRGSRKNADAGEIAVAGAEETWPAQN